jgi:hypothetical protein
MLAASALALTGGAFCGWGVFCRTAVCGRLLLFDKSEKPFDSTPMKGYSPQ